MASVNDTPTPAQAKLLRMLDKAPDGTWIRVPSWGRCRMYLPDGGPNKGRGYEVPCATVRACQKRSWIVQRASGSEYDTELVLNDWGRRALARATGQPKKKQASDAQKNALKAMNLFGAVVKRKKYSDARLILEGNCSSAAEEARQLISYSQFADRTAAVLEERGWVEEIPGRPTLWRITNAGRQVIGAEPVDEEQLAEADAAFLRNAEHQRTFVQTFEVGDRTIGVYLLQEGVEEWLCFCEMPPEPRVGTYTSPDLVLPLGGVELFDLITEAMWDARNAGAITIQEARP